MPIGPDIDRSKPPLKEPRIANGLWVLSRIEREGGPGSSGGRAPRISIVMAIKVQNDRSVESKGLALTGCQSVIVNGQFVSKSDRVLSPQCWWEWD